MPAAVPLAIVGSSVIGAAASSRASSRTTRAAESTAATNNDLQRDVYNRNTGNMQPFMEGGNRAFAAWQDFMGLGPRQGQGGQQPQTWPQQPGGPGLTMGGSGGQGGLGGGRPGAAQFGNALQDGEPRSVGGGMTVNQNDITDGNALNFGGQDTALSSGEGGLPTRPGAGNGLNGGYPAPQTLPPQTGGGPQPEVWPQQPGDAGGPQTWPTQPGQPGGTAPGNALSGYDQFKASTGYETGLAEGYRGLNARLANSGRLQSGDAGREAIRYGQNYANTFANGWLDRLMQGTQVGAGAANALAGVGTNYANAVGSNNNNALNAMANANASNANAITGLAGNAGAAAAYYYGNRPPPTASSYGGGSASSGYGRPIFWG